MTTTPKKGDIVYLADGEEAVVRGVAGEHIVVSLLYENKDGEPIEGAPVVADRVFREPPCQRMHEHAKELEKTIEDQVAKLATLRAETKQVEAMKADIARWAEKHRAVARVVDQIDGKITHVVLRHGSGVPTICTISDCPTNVSHKILTLYGKRTGGLEWRIECSCNNCGSGHTAIPCVSLEEAREEIAKILSVSIKHLTEGGWWDDLPPLIVCADTYGVPVADDIRERTRARQIRRVREATERADKEAAEARAKLQALTGGVP